MLLMPVGIGLLVILQLVQYPVGGVIAELGNDGV